MEQLTKEQFSELTKTVAQTCISIYLPTHKFGFAVNEKQDQIVFKNQLQECARQLSLKGIDPVSIDKLLNPAYEILEDLPFWRSLQHGLAVFIANNFFKFIRMPDTAKEEIYINSSFYLSPLIPQLTNNAHFFLLVFSQDACSLYKGNTYGLQKIEIAELPLGINDVIHFEEKDERRTFRGGGGTGAGTAGSNHGHGSGFADEKEYIAQYLKEVDQTLWTEVLANEKAPLILASVEYMAGIYRQVSRYQYISQEYISGNSDRETIDVLFEKVKPIAEPLLKEERKKALLNYYNNVATELTSSMPETVIPASFYSQISDLFVLENTHIWGSFDETSNQIKIDIEKQEGDECLINRAIINTLSSGGRVFVLPPGKMPKGSIIAALMRFKA